jgi:hypothetical protein
VFVRFADDEVAEGRTPDLDLERAEFELSFDTPRDNPRSAIVPLASVKRVLLGRDEINEPVPDDVLRMRTWDTRPPQLERTHAHRHWKLPRHEAPLIELLSEIRGLRGLRHRGQISDVEYERRRGQVLEKI